MNEATENKINIWKETPVIWVLLAVLAALIGYVYFDGLTKLVEIWEKREEYSYGYLIPFITLFLIWQRKDLLEQHEFTGSWAGIPIILAGILIFAIGELATLYLLIQYSFLLVILGVTLSFLGWKPFKIIIVPLLFLAFMIPLPSFFLQEISQVLQLVSSQIGVWFIRLFDISVYLEGNVIDLGVYKLQVVEACSGLRYLFPLMALSFMMAYFFQDKFWKRAFIFLSSIPITIIMNSFRIGAIGVMVEYWGIEMAEGFLHDFEGWFVFMACMVVILIEMWLLVKIGGDKRPFREVFGIEFPADTPKDASIHPRHLPVPFIIANVLVVLVAASLLLMPERVDIKPERKDFYAFPHTIENWKGSTESLTGNILDALKVDDYLLVNYTNTKNASMVNLYVAYYASQKKGQSAHSPRTCMPGGGWKMQGISQEVVAGVNVGSQPLIVNRTIIQKGEHRQLVYYWFQERGRVITNEYLVKWFILWDALEMNRTDGALVRLTTYVPPGEEIEVAEQRLKDFAKLAVEQLHDYVPN
ncbi:Eight transmembrane protein EpsH / EpsI protein [hydrothermal vent metagenome]|uniref:Eight transmembrane protein EpsH / EpsI protein n=1 Tax=hydrothermal vent metagenome TaxID=652676 RepID=A0A3B1BCC9_9ZZZZ